MLLGLASNSIIIGSIKDGPPVYPFKDSSGYHIPGSLEGAPAALLTLLARPFFSLNRIKLSRKICRKLLGFTLNYFFALFVALCRCISRALIFRHVNIISVFYDKYYDSLRGFISVPYIDSFQSFEIWQIIVLVFYLFRICRPGRVVSVTRSHLYGYRVDS